MELKRILILALCLVPVWMCKHRCCNETELNKVINKKFLIPVEPDVEPQGSSSCPLDLYKTPSRELKDRSLSPWRYVKVTKEDYLPSSYTQAECLCSGCIMMLKNGTVVQNHDYNSVPLMQTRLFQQRVPGNCRKNTYNLKYVQVKVAVGCICVRVNSS